MDPASDRAPSPDAALAAFEQAPCLLVLAEGPDLVVAALNAAARGTCGDLVGEPLDHLLPGRPGAELLEEAAGVWASGLPLEDHELPVGDAGPTDRRLTVAMAPASWPDGTPRGVVVRIEDGTPFVELDHEDEEHLADLASRRDRADEVLVMLQDALLPEGLPVPPGVRLAARYLLADDQGSSGGDWFDAVTLDDGRLALVVGDVVGHGARASVTMGELRTLFDEHVRLDGDLVGAVELLDRRARRLPQARAATICAVLLDPGTGRLTYCTAGHPGPLLVGADGEPRTLPASGSGPLGSGTPITVVERSLAEGDLLLLYSDGLVGRPGRTAGQNLEDLVSAVRRSVVDVPADVHDDVDGEAVVDRVCRETVEQLIGTTGFADDVTMLAVQRVPAPEPLTMVLPAFPDTPRAVRSNVGDWLAEVGATTLDEMALQHALGELVSNVVTHAYPDGHPRAEATVEVTVRLTGQGLVEAEVRDRGTWRVGPVATDRGRGLAMARGFVDELDVQHDAGGTRARLRHRLSRPVDLLRPSAGRTGRPGPRPVGQPLAVSDADGVLSVAGVVDDRSSDELRRHLAQATRGGTRDLVVDLSAVTVLASAGVQVLWEEVGAGDRGPTATDVHLVAAPGTPAQHVLDLVQLPHSPSAPVADD